VISRTSSLINILSDIDQISVYALENCTLALISTINSSPEIAGLRDLAPQTLNALSNVSKKLCKILLI
jgi:hypothetical protein